jgi:hypothetical protein
MSQVGTEACEVGCARTNGALWMRSLASTEYRVSLEDYTPPSDDDSESGSENSESGGEDGRRRLGERQRRGRRRRVVHGNR